MNSNDAMGLIDGYFPLHLWLQPVDDFGVEVGEARQTMNLDLLHAQVGDRLKNPRYVSEDKIDAHLEGEWVVQEREFVEHSGAPYGTPRNFTLYIRKP